MNFNFLSKRIAFPVILISCILLAIVIVKSQSGMQHEPAASFITPVKTIEIQQFSLKPSITGFGIVEPDIQFEAKSEVAGKIVYVHPQLRNGATFAENSIVIRIEADDFQSSLQQAKADTAVNQAQLREVVVKLKNTQSDLKLAQQKLKLAQNDLNRAGELVKKKLVSQSNFEAQKSKVIQLQQEVQNLKSLLKTLPEQKASLQASLSNTQAAAQSKQRNLDRTTIRLPFNARISDLAVEENQYVSQGALLFTAQTTDKVLIDTQLPLEQFRILAKDFGDNQEQIREAFQRGFSLDLLTQLGLTATVRLGDDFSALWDAKVERISSQLDPVIRTLGVIVSIDKPYAQIQPGIKPPLIDGMYTEVVIKGNPKKYFVIPRDALHEGELFLLTQQNTLQRRTLKPGKLQGSMALFETGLQVGEKLIVSDPFPAISGMSIKPSPNKNLQHSIALWVETQQ
jgi:multidrug efflux pump subunit AcrA (membrane-fusion protein)